MINIKSVYLFAFEDRENSHKEVIYAFTKLLSFEFIVYAEKWICNLVKNETNICISSNISKADLIMSIGGDGTLLRAANLSLVNNKHLIGVNSGRLGFLTEFDLNDIENNALSLKNGNYFIENRGTLSLTFNENIYHVVNDVVISRGGFSKLVSFKVYVDNDEIGCYFADGLIIATPTGSTGYSLSAGGPVVSPNINCMIITPICAHSLQHRPVIVSGNDIVTIKLDCQRKQEVQLNVDGIEIANINANSVITVQSSNIKLDLVRFNKAKFFTRVKLKLSEWSN